ncbi:unnamed protein product [Closterium sp. NIES-65]|nr:unnamed protein product [Closterium sp. NIES-65]
MRRLRSCITTHSTISRFQTVSCLLFPVIHPIIHPFPPILRPLPPIAIGPPKPFPQGPGGQRSVHCRLVGGVGGGVGGGVAGGMGGGVVLGSVTGEGEGAQLQVGDKRGEVRERAGGGAGVWGSLVLASVVLIAAVLASVVLIAAVLASVLLIAAVLASVLLIAAVLASVLLIAAVLASVVLIAAVLASVLLIAAVLASVVLIAAVLASVLLIAAVLASVVLIAAVLASVLLIAAVLASVVLIAAVLASVLLIAAVLASVLLIAAVLASVLLIAAVLASVVVSVLIVPASAFPHSPHLSRLLRPTAPSGPLTFRVSPRSPLSLCLPGLRLPLLRLPLECLPLLCDSSLYSRHSRYTLHHRPLQLNLPSASLHPMRASLPLPLPLSSRPPIPWRFEHVLDTLQTRQQRANSPLSRLESLLQLSSLRRFFRQPPFWRVSRRRGGKCAVRRIFNSRFPVTF